MQGIINFSQNHPIIFATILSVLVAWSLVWKGTALWKAAHREQKGWFVLLLLINTFGLLEMFYVLKDKRGGHNMGIDPNADND